MFLSMTFDDFVASTRKSFVKNGHNLNVILSVLFFVLNKILKCDNFHFFRIQLLREAKLKKSSITYHLDVYSQIF